MSNGTHEQTINAALGEVLEELGQDWIIASEKIGKTLRGGGRPDILIQKPDGWAIVIEAEVGNHRQAEIEAQARLGKRLASSTTTIDMAIALAYPPQVREQTGQALRETLQSCVFEYVLFVSEVGEEIKRIPSSGWLSGDLKSLALFVHRSTVPEWRVESLTDTLETGITRAEGKFSSSHPIGSAVGLRIVEILGQGDDPDGQARKMAMTLIVNALIFHEALAQSSMLVTDSVHGSIRGVLSPSEFRQDENFLPTMLRDEWNRILNTISPFNK